jgi:hypothetical protein
MAYGRHDLTRLPENMPERLVPSRFGSLSANEVFLIGLRSLISKFIRNFLLAGRRARV